MSDRENSSTNVSADHLAGLQEAEAVCRRYSAKYREAYDRTGEVSSLTNALAACECAEEIRLLGEWKAFWGRTKKAL